MPWQSAKHRKIFIQEPLEHGLVQFLIYDEMTQSARGDDGYARWLVPVVLWPVQWRARMRDDRRGVGWLGA